MSTYYRELLQRTEDWHGIRYGKIGGSSASDLMIKKGLVNSSVLNQITAEHIEEFFYDEDDNFTSRDMQRGIDFEPFAVDELNKLTGLVFSEIGWVQSKYNLLGISPDGLTKDNKTACEVKCPSAKVHIEYIKSKTLPLPYVWQIVNYFASIDDLDVLYFASYRPENKIKPLFSLRLTIDSEINIGTVAKPIKVTIREAVAMLHNRAIELEKLVNETIESLEF